MSQINTIRKAAICLTGPQAHAYSIVLLAERLPAAFQTNRTVPTSVWGPIAQATKRAQEVLDFKARKDAQ
jgi:hypothetical protein